MFTIPVAQVAKVIVGILPLQKLVTTTAEMLHGSKDLPDRYRSLELVIINGMKNTSLKFKEEFFDSGACYTHPETTVPPYNYTIVTVANGRGCPIGVTGGLAFSIEGTGENLIIGFTNPILGCMKSYIEKRKGGRAETAYDKCEDGKKKVIKDGKFTLEAMFEESKIADRKVLYLITDISEEEAKAIAYPGHSNSMPNPNRSQVYRPRILYQNGRQDRNRSHSTITFEIDERIILELARAFEGLFSAAASRNRTQIRFY